jgi:hypothetical protein
MKFILFFFSFLVFLFLNKSLLVAYHIYLYYGLVIGFAYLSNFFFIKVFFSIWVFLMWSVFLVFNYLIITYLMGFFSLFFFDFYLWALINIYFFFFLNLFLNVLLNDFKYYYTGFQKLTLKHLFTTKFVNLINLFNDKRKYFLKKYIYTINHKRIAINYFFFSMWSGLSGAALATMIRLELAYPGSHFFKGDSIRYLQVITAHGLIMVFFVVVPIIFGGFANFLIPYHVGSKDVAFPRLNSMGF